MITEDDEAHKTAFAVAFLKTPDDAFKAACTVFPDDMGKALRAAHTWQKDSFVVYEMERLTGEDGEDAFLPGKAELCRKIWSKLNKEFVDNEDFTKLAKLYADVRGFIQKADTTVNVAVVNKVMVVKDLGSNEEWESKAERQQRELLNVSTSRH